MIPLHIFSDPICPWCYIGKTRLDRALEARPQHPLTIQWHPFQLNPEMPAGGMDRRDYLETKFGGKDGAVRAYMPVVEEAAASGLEIDFEAIKRTPNTLDAHRLIHWAGIEGRQTAAVSRLFRAYFNEGLDIGDTITISDVTLPAGAKPTIDRDFVIANISAPSALASASGDEEGDGEEGDAPEAEAAGDEGGEE